MTYYKSLEEAPEVVYPKGATFKNKIYDGEIVGSWFVVGLVGVRKYTNSTSESNHPVWLVKCGNCSSYATVISYTIMRGKNRCLECTKTESIGANAFNWKGGQYVPQTMFSAIKDRVAKSGRDIPIEVTVEDLDEVWVAQNGMCVYTGLPLTFGQSGTRGTASIDRINSSVGYERGNVQFVHKDVNTMKWDFSEERFLEICALVAQHTKDKGDFEF